MTRYVILYLTLCGIFGYAGWEWRGKEMQLDAMKALAEQKQILIEKTKEKGELINAHATAYLCKDPRERRFHGITKSGARCVPGRSAAVDPSVIPFGSIIYVPALRRYYIAEDTGNMITGNAIDFSFRTREKAMAFGRKNLTVVVMRQGI